MCGLVYKRKVISLCSFVINFKSLINNLVSLSAMWRQFPRNILPKMAEKVVDQFFRAQLTSADQHWPTWQSTNWKVDENGSDHLARKHHIRLKKPFVDSCQTYSRQKIFSSKRSLLWKLNPSFLRHCSTINSTWEINCFFIQSSISVACYSSRWAATPLDVLALIPRGWNSGNSSFKKFPFYSNAKQVCRVMFLVICALNWAWFLLKRI